VTQSEDDNVIISSALLIVSTFYQRGVRWMLESIREILAHLNKQMTNHILATDRARNCRRKEMVSIHQFSCSTYQKLGNLRCQTCDCVEQQLCNKVAWLCCMFDMGLKVKPWQSSQWEETSWQNCRYGCHLPYGSHSVTCHPTPVNTPRLNHSQ